MRQNAAESATPAQSSLKLAGMETSKWEALEAGKPPSPSALHSIAAALGATISQIAPMVLICQDAWRL